MTRTLYANCLPLDVDFASLEGADRVCEIRVLIAEAHKLLRKEIPQTIVDEKSFFYGPWLVWRNLMNEHPAACLDEYRHMATYFDADSNEMVTEICGLIEQHIELTRQSTRLHPHQEKIMDQIAELPTATVTLEAKQTARGRNFSETLGLRADDIRRFADELERYMRTHVEENARAPMACHLIDKIGRTDYEGFSDQTEDEMFAFMRETVFASIESVPTLSQWAEEYVVDNNLPQEGLFDEAADDENYALRG